MKLLKILIFTKNIKHSRLVVDIVYGTGILLLKIGINLCWYFFSKLKQIIRMDPDLGF